MLPCTYISYWVPQAKPWHTYLGTGRDCREMNFFKLRNEILSMSFLNRFWGFLGWILSSEQMTIPTGKGSIGKPQSLGKHRIVPLDTPGKVWWLIMWHLGTLEYKWVSQDLASYPSPHWDDHLAPFPAQFIKWLEIPCWPWVPLSL